MGTGLGTLERKVLEVSRTAKKELLRELNPLNDLQRINSIKESGVDGTFAMRICYLADGIKTAARGGLIGTGVGAVAGTAAGNTRLGVGLGLVLGAEADVSIYALRVLHSYVISWYNEIKEWYHTKR